MPGTSKQSGIALVIVLWMLVLLTLMAAGYSKSMRTETMLTALQVQAAQSRALAEAGVWLALQDLLKPEIERSWETNGSVNTFEHGAGKIELSIQDEAGKIDLNTGRVELLKSLLQSAATEELQEEELLDAILDWRDRDQLRRASGAEDAEYQSIGLDYGAKDGPFNSIEELRLVLGMNETLFAKIRPALTIHSHQPGINPDLAPQATLLALPGMSTDSVDAFLDERGEADTVRSDVFFTGVDKRFFSNAKGRALTITSTGMVADSKLRLDVVVMLKRNAKPPFSVLSWRQAKPKKRVEDNSSE